MAGDSTAIAEMRRKFGKADVPGTSGVPLRAFPASNRPSTTYEEELVAGGPEKFWEQSMHQPDTADVLYGVAAIGKFLGMTRAVAQHRIDAGLIPHFRLGGRICVRRSTLLAWLDEQERATGRRPAEGLSD